MNRKVSIRIINKTTGRESKAQTFKFLKAIDTYDKIDIPVNCKISIR